MPRGDKSSYAAKQKREARHIEQGYEDRGVSEKESARRAWATVNRQDGGGKKKAVAKKKAAAGKRPATRKSTGARKKTAARKTTASRAKKPAAKKSTAKRTTARKTAARRKKA
jgi:hypothetical protein